ncbi:hypothetical protein [[Mycobacterium] nativiensis]|uniref:Helix-turn-helix domain-containing protein n=1 Tax=[Mycobacterium] nativiensis TaxID=2855503 RepID=A0ABU5XWG9_9MYCO|nr:hypothetical protein [Mycolicibacter sp. MYC340]MEB3032283.1 hypothetical protein [Mycolicibacter sp. MYC340]
MSAPTPALTTREVAEKIGTDPKTLRVFLRATSEGVGSGSRYSFTAKDVAPLKAKFTKWLAEREASKKAKVDEAKSA